MTLHLKIKQRFRQFKIARDYSRYINSRPSGYELFSDDRVQYKETLLEKIPAYDIINLHWIAGFIDYGAFFSRLRKNAPIIWTLHDMNPFTGGCHYDHGCGRYQNACGSCPQLGSKQKNDLSHQVWKRKKSTLDTFSLDRLHIVTLSRWMAEEVRNSSILARFSVTVIPNGIDIDTFAPRDPVCSREVMGIPPSVKTILFMAQSIDNRRKGFSLLSCALKKLENKNVFLFSVGKGHPSLKTEIPHLHLDYINSEQLLSAVYSAADVFVIPSVQDNLPNTVLESMACGTPVIGFNVGGIQDMVKNGTTGALVPAEDVNALREAIVHLLNDTAKRQEMSKNCREIAKKEYALDVQAKRYMKLYESVLNGH